MHLKYSNKTINIFYFNRCQDGSCDDSESEDDDKEEEGRPPFKSGDSIDWEAYILDYYEEEEKMVLDDGMPDKSSDAKSDYDGENEMMTVAEKNSTEIEGSASFVPYTGSAVKDDDDQKCVGGEKAPNDDNNREVTSTMLPQPVDAVDQEDCNHVQSSDMFPDYAKPND